MAPLAAFSGMAMNIYIRMLLIGLLLGISYEAYPQKGDVCSAPQQKGQDSKKITYRLLRLPDNTWGYDIMVNAKPFIHQVVIPGASTTQGFKTDGAAERVAKLVTKKIKAGVMPPTVTIDELKKLKAL